MKTKIPDAVLAAEVSRRGLVKTTAIGGLAMASSALTLPFSRIAHAVDSAIPTTYSSALIPAEAVNAIAAHAVQSSFFINI